MIIARYNNIICEYSSEKLGRRGTIKFLGFFEESDDMFIATYRKKYPSHRFQIFGHKKKCLLKYVRNLIETSPEIKSKLRDYNLSKLLVD
jgi:hypothetical protein